MFRYLKNKYQAYKVHRDWNKFIRGEITRAEYEAKHVPKKNT